MMKRPMTRLTVIAAALAVAMTALPASGQTVTTLGTQSGVEGVQWHHEYAPGKRIRSMMFTQVVPDGETAVALQNTLIRPIRFLATDSGNVTAREEEAVCLDAGAFDAEGNPVPNHVCQNEHTIPAHDEPAVVSCTATDYSLDCAGQNPMPDTVRFGIVSVDNDCRSMEGVSVTVTFADDTTETGRWNIADDDLLDCP